MIPATLTLSAARESVWDAIILGAGPAGSVAATGLARRGLRVLLVERAQFPRYKLCGTCLNGDAQAVLTELQLAEPLRQLGGVPLHDFVLRSQGQQISLPLPAGIAIRRSRLDAMLVESAIVAGADFLPGTCLQVEPSDSDCGYRTLVTQPCDGAGPLRARVVVVATGLAATRLGGDPALAVTTVPGARIGAGTVCENFPTDYRPGVIFMAVGRAGYVGLTRTDGGSLNLAAAFDPLAVRQDDLPTLCSEILLQAGFPCTESMVSGEWHGTIGLTRQRRTPAAERLFVIGDAAGYVEPFTGQGMAWALHGGQSVVEFVARSVHDWDPRLIPAWSHETQRLIGQRQRWCRTFARVLRYPVLVHGLLRMVMAMPSLGQAVIRRINQ